jgi:hypothetical protein
MVFIVFVSIVLYIFSCFCLKRIAEKTNQENIWMAWIPIANIFLTCKIAGLSYWWILGFLLAIIPYVGWLCVSCVVVYMWYKICLLLKKPVLFAFLMAVPLANFVVMGYLAFSE